MAFVERDWGRKGSSFLDQSGARHLRPNKEGAGTQYPVVGWPQQMPPDPKEIQDDSVNRQESLGLSDGLEPSHLSLPLSGWLMGDLGPIVGVAAGVVNNGRHYSSMRCPITPQLVGHQPPRFASLALQELAKEPLGCTPIATRLHENVEDVAVLINSVPEILSLTLDRDQELIQVPGVAQATFSPLELSSVLSTKLPRPLSDGLVGHDDAALSQEIFDISEAQTESVVEPNSVADDLGREPVSAVARCFGVHRRSLPGNAST